MNEAREQKSVCIIYPSLRPRGPGTPVSAVCCPPVGLLRLPRRSQRDCGSVLFAGQEGGHCAADLKLPVFSLQQVECLKRF